MESFYRTHAYLVEHTNAPVRRDLMDEIDWSDRLIGIKGTRGVGKTTFLLQYAKEKFGNDRSCLFINMNNFYFSGHSIVDFANEFQKRGGKVLLIDQVFKHPEWSKELRMCYDRFPNLKIVFTGSSVMRLKEENLELRDIAKSYNLRGFSFREFLNLQTGMKFRAYSLEEILSTHEQIAKGVLSKVTKIDHKDQRAVKMAYHIYDQVIKEGYSLIAIRESLTYDRVDIEPVPDRTLENSRVELEQTSDQTEKEKNVHKADKADGKAKVIFQKAIEHFFPDLAKIKEYRQELAKKKEKKNEIQPIVFEPEEEEVRMGRPTVLLADQKKTIQGILRYEGNNQLSDLKIDTFPYVIGSAADCPGYVDCATISRHHAKITKVENVYFIEDMNSANGTKAGGTLLDYKMKVSLQANEILEFADEKFRFI